MYKTKTTHERYPLRQTCLPLYIFVQDCFYLSIMVTKLQNPSCATGLYHFKLGHRRLQDFRVSASDILKTVEDMFCLVGWNFLEEEEESLKAALLPICSGTSYLGLEQLLGQDGVSAHSPTGSPTPSTMSTPI